jgi:hypothetical protein
MREIDRVEIKRAAGDLFQRSSCFQMSLEFTPGGSELVRNAAAVALAARARQ